MPRNRASSTSFSIHSVPEIRISALNHAPVRRGGEYVLYWMIAFRRLHWNFALDRAIEHASKLKKPLIILEALRCDYPWACDRFHRFVLDGMAEKIRCKMPRGVLYFPCVEPARSASRGLLKALARRACVVVTDDYPCFFLPRMLGSTGRRLHVRLEAVDSNGLLPLRAADHAFPTAFSFRRFLQHNLPKHLTPLPKSNPLAHPELPPLRAIPNDITRRWPPTRLGELSSTKALARLPIDHRIAAAAIRGGEQAAQQFLKQFVTKRLNRYAEDRNEPDQDAASGLSPYLHFGHISVHQVFSEVMKREHWSDAKLSLHANGRREGWWGVSPAVEAFLDQLITWREVGFNFASTRADYDRYESLPPWARKTLATHAKDERASTYSLGEFAEARTHDPLWNAAQRQLVREGRIHNYIRMLWGKKILEWSRTPRRALEVMIELNNRYALDGRDPNSYCGIFWCLGRYDRPWGPERPIFGTVRYMSSENTARKLRVKNYLKKYGVGSGA